MKKSINHILLIIFLLFIQLHGKAQNVECGTDYLHHQLMQTDAVYNKEITQLESQVQSMLQQQRNAGTQGVVYTIPVVVHVIHMGEAVGKGTNISDSTIRSAIDGLSYRFRAGSGISINTEIQFCLASRDPAGKPTSGINRVNGTILPRYQTHGISMLYTNCDAPSEDSVKALSRWPVSDYYNIWVVNKICQNFGSFLALTTYPHGGVDDGMVIVSGAVTGGTSTLTHEMGHGFFLFHTFEGDGGNAYCPANTDCSTDGDRVCDTPPHKQNDCGTSNPCTTDGTWASSLNNYMSYCSLKNRFTQGQKDRMRATAIVYPRASLLTSSGCVSPAGMEEISSSDLFSVFPNPAANQLTIHPVGWSSNGVNASSFHANEAVIFSIKNVLGQRDLTPNPLHMERGDASIDISKLHAGIYFLQMKSESGMVVRKFVKECTK